MNKELETIDALYKAVLNTVYGVMRSESPLYIIEVNECNFKPYSVINGGISPVLSADEPRVKSGLFKSFAKYISYFLRKRTRNPIFKNKVNTINKKKKTSKFSMNSIERFELFLIVGTFAVLFLIAVYKTIELLYL